MKTDASGPSSPAKYHGVLALALAFLVVTPASSHARSKRRHADAPSTRPEVAAGDTSSGLDGAAFVFVEGQGIRLLQEAGSTLLMPTTSAVRDMQLDSEGGLWASLRDAGVVRIVRGQVVTLCKESFEKLAVLSPTDVWAINDGHGSVVHFDGGRWKTVRTRKNFPGAQQDNRLLDIVTDGRTLWVSGWNGLWRARAGRWTPVDPPTIPTMQPAPTQPTEAEPIGAAGPPFPLSLVVSRPGLIACYPEGCFLSGEAGWQSSHWPSARARLQTAGATNLLAGTGADGRTVVIARLDGSVEPATSETLPAVGINDIAVDSAERIWVAVGSTLMLLDVRGHTLARWKPSTSGDNAAAIQRVVVAGAGPKRLPTD